MIDRALIFQTHIALGQIVLSAKACGLTVPSRPWPAMPPDGTTVCFGSHLHEDESVLALTYGVGPHRVTWLLDPWARSTLDAVESARGAGGFFVFYVDRPEPAPAPTNFASVCAAAVDAILGELRTHRRGRLAPEPAGFVRRALQVDVIADHAIHLHHPERHFAGLPGSTSVTVLLGTEHVAAMGLPRRASAPH